MAGVPTGTVTFLFTDIEGSTKLTREHPGTWETLQALQHTFLRLAIPPNSGNALFAAICLRAISHLRRRLI